MSIFLGNLDINRLEKLTGWKFNKEDKEWLEKHRTDTADFKDLTKFHIFDIPTHIIIGIDIKD